MGFSYNCLTRKVRVGIACVLIVTGPQAVYAGSSVPQHAPSSVNLANASMDELRTHILDSCVLREWGRTAEPKSSYAERCSCYARRITADMNGEELDALRQSGVYNASARSKAEAAQVRCNL